MNFSPFINTSTSDGVAGALSAESLYDPEYMIVGPVAVALPAEVYTYNILLKDILPDSIFNMDQDLYFNKVLYLRITWNSIDQLGAKSLTAIGAAEGIALAFTIPLTNLNLNVYVQANPVINQLTQQKFGQQQEIIIPDIQCNSIGLTGTYQNTWVKVIWNSLKAALYKTYNLITMEDVVKNKLNSNNIGDVKWTTGKLYVNADLI